MATYNLRLLDDGSGGYTPTIIRAGTPSSGGTAVALPVPDNGASDLDIAIARVVRRMKNDRADGN